MTISEQLDARLMELGVPPYVMSPKRFKAVLNSGFCIVVREIKGSDNKRYMEIYFMHPNGHHAYWL